MSDTDTICSLNDRFRKGDTTVPGQILITRGLADLLEERKIDMTELAVQVRDFDQFTPENDPHKAHDFGKFEFLGETCFWKIDVFDPSYELAALDPCNTNLSARVLTVMLASEY